MARRTIVVLVERSAHVRYASAGLAYSVSGEAVSPEARIAHLCGHRDAGYLAGGLLSWKASGRVPTGSAPE